MRRSSGNGDENKEAKDTREKLTSAMANTFMSEEFARKFARLSDLRAATKSNRVPRILSPQL